MGRGYQPIPSPEVAEFVQQYIEPKSSPRRPLPSSQILERVLFALVNEGFKCLEDKIALRPSDIDVIYVFGYGWQAWRGGPMYWAYNTVGLERLLRGLERFSEQFPLTEHYVPSQLLLDCVRQEVSVEEYYKRIHEGGNRPASSKL